MAKIVILGAGVMGSAFGQMLVDAGHDAIIRCGAGWTFCELAASGKSADGRGESSRCEPDERDRTWPRGSV